MSRHDRRTFLKLTGAGALALGGTKGLQAAASPVQASGSTAPSTADVAVIGAGAFGGWTALYLREMGALQSAHSTIHPNRECRQRKWNQMWV